MFIHKKYRKRIVAGVLTISLLLPTVNLGITRYYDDPTKEFMNVSFSDVAEQTVLQNSNKVKDISLVDKQIFPSGLSCERTDLDKNRPDSGFVKQWLKLREKEIRTYTLHDVQPNGAHQQVEIDFSKLDGHYTTCIADHTPPSTGYMNGLHGQMFVTGVFFPTNNFADYPAIIKNKTKDIQTAKFLLLLMSYLHSPSYDQDVLWDSVNGTAADYLCFLVTRLIEEPGIKPGLQGKDFNTDWALIEKWMDPVELVPGFAPNKDLDSTVYDEMHGAKIKDWFAHCWEAAQFFSNFTFNNGYILTKFSEPQPSQIGGGYYATFEVPLKRGSGTEPVIPGGEFTIVQAMANGLDWDHSIEGADLSIQKGATTFGMMAFAQTPEDLNKLIQSITVDVAKTGSFKDTTGNEMMMAPGGLVALKEVFFKDTNNNGKIDMEEAGTANVYCQSRFAAYNTNPRFSSTSSHIEPEGDFEVTVDRYKHEEVFTATYNVNLHKYDSETGKPLESSEFDILEAFDSSQLEGTSLESSDNWANRDSDWSPDNPDKVTSQFQTWEGWDYGPGNEDGDEENDPCKIEVDVTNEEGILTNRSAGDAAHSDVKSYTYTKGYCGGHPAPEIEYAEYEGEDPDIQDQIDDYNAALEDAAQKAWEDEVKKCEELAAQGGFFHSIEEGEGQTELEEDRDQAFKDFQSLKYQYSAVETSARSGYIVHGTHTDDIPIETVTVSSSESMDMAKNGGEIPHVEGTGDEEDDEESEDINITRTRIKLNTTGKTVESDEDTVQPEEIVERSVSIKKALSTNEEEIADIKDENDTVEILNESLSQDETGTSENDETDEDKEENESYSESDSDAIKEQENNDISTNHADKEDTENIEIPFISGGWIRNILNGIMPLAIDDDEDSENEDVDINDIEFKDSEASRVGDLDPSIVAHTFIVFDHRTEGEIHFNKRDFNLSEVEDYDSYSKENGDGTLEGAVYGLFAASDIVHPDGHTGTVYKSGDLVAVTTTDRNGDGSFMVFTEAPGMTYDYKTGKIVETGDGWASEAPKNLHQNQSAGDAYSEDNETYIGNSPEGKEVTLIDSDAVDDTVYNKHSSNQEGVEIISEGGYETYPISNNEDNNGNCWIGRPLIAASDGSQYYIKELSRSEGYELSVGGKSNQLTNGKDSELHAYKSPNVKVSNPPAYDSATYALHFTVTTDTIQDLTFESSNIRDNMSFAVRTTRKVPYMGQVPKEVPREEPVIGRKDSYVYKNGERVEASIGDMVEINGIQYRVNNVSKPENQYIGFIPKNNFVFSTPKAQTYGTYDYDSFVAAYNEALRKSGYGIPDEKAPWLKIPISGTNDIGWVSDIQNYLIDHDIFYFRRIRIKEIIRENGQAYAMVVYDYSLKNAGEPYHSMYSAGTDTMWVKKDLPNGYFVYVPYKSDDPAVVSVTRDESGYITTATIDNENPVVDVTYPEAYPETFTMRKEDPKTYWTYDGVQQMFNDDGTLASRTVYDTVYEDVQMEREEEILVPLEATYKDGKWTITVPQDLVTEEFVIKVYSEDPSYLFWQAGKEQLTFIPSGADEDSYIKNITLSYQDQDTVIESSGTNTEPVQVLERPIRQQVLITKDIQILPETKEVWYCSFCGHENADDVEVCAGCERERSIEETKTVSYAHDTYSAVHSDNLSTEKKTLYESVRDWLTSLLTGKEIPDSADHIPDFRFKTYLKSNLERLYRDEDGNIVWVDENGNKLTPNYQDTNKDGNYDTFTWTRTDQTDSSKSEIDFPEKQILNDTTLASANVQKIYTEVRHLPDSTTIGEISNTTWADYDTPQGGDRNEVGSLTAYTTSQDGQNGIAVSVNDSLYSYNGKNVNTAVTDRLNADQNDGYTRVLESTVRTIEDGAGKTREVSTYNYKKFFDAIYTANTDKWDNDMFASGKNYPGQHWFETFYERYQKDDADTDFTLDNVDGTDSDGTAGGDRNTSFKPFRWIREKLFGDSFESKSEYPSVHDNPNKENVINTSAIAHENAEASDAVRQFAIDWYLKDEVAKLVINNGYDEDQAKNLQIQGTDIVVDEFAGPIDYSEQIYDIALYNALAKSVNYLKPFYDNDLDTIYSVEWDSESDGGADNDYTTLSANVENTDRDGYYKTSAYLPYGTYVLVEQQPERIDDSVNDFKTKNYKTDDPKEIILPAFYADGTSNNTTDNYDPEYFYDSSKTPEDLAAEYQIRFNEEWAENHTDDLRHYVIRAHNNDGDFEVYKYGLETDKLTGSIDYSGGSYNYKGYEITQDTLEPLKDYYNPVHKVYGENITAADGANEGSHYLADDVNKGVSTANGAGYAEDAIEERYHYGSISENAGTTDNVLFPNGSATDDNNPSGFYFKDGVKTMTGQQTAYEGKFASMLVPWSILAPADVDLYENTDFTGYADKNFRNTFYVTKLRIEKLDSETGENILHDDAVFALYAASRYTSQDEVDDAISNGAPATTKIGDVKFFLEDTQITGSYEFLKAMKADNIQQKRRIFGNDPNIFSGIVKAGTPVCMEEERIMLYDEEGSRFGDMTVYTTDNDVYMLDEDKEDKSYDLQNTGYFVTPQPVGAGVYVLAEIKPPTGYVRTNPIAIEVYSDNVSYYVDGDMYAHVNATVYHDNLIK